MATKPIQYIRLVAFIGHGFVASVKNMSGERTMRKNWERNSETVSVLFFLAERFCAEFYVIWHVLFLTTSSNITNTSSWTYVYGLLWHAVQLTALVENGWRKMTQLQYDSFDLNRALIFCLCAMRDTGALFAETRCTLFLNHGGWRTDDLRFVRSRLDLSDVVNF